MAPSRRASNGRSPLVNPQRHITSFFSLKPSSSSSSPDSVLRASSSRQTEDNTPSPSPPLFPKIKKPPSPPGIPASGSSILDSGKKLRQRRAMRTAGVLSVSGLGFSGRWTRPGTKVALRPSIRGLGLHAIIYDDGEEEVLDLGKEKVNLLGDQVRSFRLLQKSLDHFPVKPPMEMEVL